MKESMVFYASWLDAIKNLPREMQGEVLTSIIEYGLQGETTASLKPITKAMLALVKTQIDTNNRRYENSLKGGRKRGDGQEGESGENQTETKPKPKANQTETKLKPNPNQTETYNVNDNVNENVSLPPIVPPPGGAGEAFGVGDGDRDPSAVDYDRLAGFYNRATAGRLTPLSGMTDGRRRAAARIVAEHGKAALCRAIATAARSPHLCGGGDRGWRADFDWLTRPANFVRVLEGAYLPAPPPPKGPTEAEREAMAERRRTQLEHDRRRAETEAAAVTYEQWRAMRSGKDGGGQGEGGEP